MLNTLELNCFRQFENKTVNFSKGNTAIRGRNEGGKSTLLEAFFYAIGGSRCCRNNDFVMWGAKPSSCRVVATLELGGAQLRVVRSPKGAEIYINNDPTPAVTGQTEVTNFIQEQIGGVPMELASRMMFVAQGDIRGMLELRPGEKGGAVDTIERLAGLDIVDYFITEIQKSGKTGDTTVLEMKLAGDKQELDDTHEASFDEGILQLEGSLAELQRKSLAAGQELEKAETAAAELTAKVAAATSAGHEVTLAKTRVSKAEAAVAERQQSLVDLQEAHKQWPPASDIQGELNGVTAALASAEQLEQKVLAFQQFKAYQTPAQRWEGSLQSFETYLEDVRNRVSATSAAMTSASNDIRVLQVQKITETVCGLCGKDVSSIPEVASKNAEIDAKIAKLQAEFDAAKKANGEAASECQVAETVRRLPAPKLSSQYVELVDSHWPPVPKWIGGDVPENTDADVLREREKKLQRRLTELAKLNNAISTDTALLRQAEERLLEETAALEKAKAALQQHQEADLQSALQLKQQDVANCRSLRNELSAKVGETQANLTGLRASRDLHQKRVLRLQESVAELQTELGTFHFNNDLISALRTARPLVANQLWSMVLKAVSTFFTKMRSEASVVERVEKTFTVNGHPFTSLSGSAVDLLGLAIRIALVKVFVPGNDMLILDEPFSACDEARTQQCLAFAALAGFKQVIVITHEGDTEQVFDYLVTV